MEQPERRGIVLYISTINGSVKESSDNFNLCPKFFHFNFSLCAGLDCDVFFVLKHIININNYLTTFNFEYNGRENE